MHQEKVSFADTHSFSSFFLDYISHGESLRPFYHRFPEIPAFAAQIKDKSSFPLSRRNLLVEVLLGQYLPLKPPAIVTDNITSLAAGKTFTVTTGHQLNIFTGPLYFIYKIVTVINTCRQLAVHYPGYRFVPVYWMASEDHDFEEISYLHLRGKKYVWQTKQRGCVGRFDPASLKTLLDEIPGVHPAFRDAYLKNKSLSGAVRQYVNELFGAEGLVVIDADDRALKGLFTEPLRQDLFDHTPYRLVRQTSDELEKLGYKVQVHPRDINLFYIGKGTRDRIERRAGTFSVVDSNFNFSDAEMRAMIDSQPEELSPNVILRPLYQEMILPNLAYVGGPSELVYWLQLKQMFDHFAVPFPVLIPRNFGLVVDAPLARKWAKTGLSYSELFEEKNLLFSRWAHLHNRALSLQESTAQVQAVFDEVRSRAAAIDQTLGPLVGAETKATVNRLEKIETKLVRAEKRRHADKLHQISAVKDALFPQGSLQERIENFMGFWQQNPAFIARILQAFDPFDFRFNILVDD